MDIFNGLQIRKLCKALGGNDYSNVELSLESLKGYQDPRVSECIYDFLLNQSKELFSRNHRWGESIHLNLCLKAGNILVQLEGTNNIKKRLLENSDTSDETWFIHAILWGVIGTNDAIDPLKKYFFYGSRGIGDSSIDINRGRIHSVAEEGLLAIGESAIDPLLPLLSDKESNIRYCTAVVLGKLKAVRSIPHLIDMLKQPQIRERRGAIDALARIGDPVVIDDLIQTLNDNSPEIRIAAIKALTQFNDPKIYDILVKLLEGEFNDRVIDEANSAIMKLGKPIPIESRHFTEDEWHNKASEFLKDYRFEEAIKCFKKVLEINPNNTDALRDLGRAREMSRYIRTSFEDKSRPG